jgi:hypothetical protein
MLLPKVQSACPLIAGVFCCTVIMASTNTEGDAAVQAPSGTRCMCRLSLDAGNKAKSLHEVNLLSLASPPRARRGSEQGCGTACARLEVLREAIIVGHFRVPVNSGSTATELTAHGIRLFIRRTLLGRYVLSHKTRRMVQVK